MKVLLVVDYQNDFVEGSLGSPDAVSIEGRICDRIEEVLSEGGDVIFTMDTHDCGYLSTFEGRRLPVEHCIAGTHGHRLYGRVGSYAGEGRIIEKSSFGCPELMEILGGYDDIELCGVATNICVMSNAILARTAAPEARITVRRDCVASYDRVEGERALEVMPSLQIDVV